LAESQTSIVINAHRGRKGRRGGIEFNVQKVKHHKTWQETSIGNAFWQPEDNIS